MELDDRIEAALQAGDHATAATEAIRGYGPAILGYLAGVLRDSVAAREAFAQFTEDLWKGIASYRGEGSFRGWAYTVAYNAGLRVANETFHKRGRRLETAEHSRLADEIWTRTPIHQQTEVKDRLRKLREKLTPDERTLLILRVDRDLGWDEVAGVLGITEPAARKRFERLKERLRELARDEGDDAPG